jgi:hypothetical protein
VIGDYGYASLIIGEPFPERTALSTFVTAVVNGELRNNRVAKIALTMPPTTPTNHGSEITEHVL